LISIILAGGYATRLWPITKDTPKPLLPLGSKLIIDYVVDEILRVEMIERIIVSTNVRFSWEFQGWLDNKGQGEKIQLHAEQTTKEEEKMGAVKALSNLIEQYESDSYLIVAVDNIFSLDLRDLLNFYKMFERTVIALYDVGDLNLASRYGNVKLDIDGKVVSFIEKPSKPETTLISTGIYILSKNTMERVHEYLEEGNPPDAPGHFFNWLSKREEIYGYKFSGYWFDIGSMDSYLQAFKQLVKESSISYDASIDQNVKIAAPIIIEEGSILAGECIIGPYSYIGRRAYIEDSHLKETVVLDEAKLINSEMVKCILGRRSIIKNLSLNDSMIGDYTRLSGSR
jgi:glucose-1-phosphate thymidylyltransferase